MAGRGRTPKPATERHGHQTLTRGDWQAAPGVGWQHGPIPPPPDGLLPESAAAWASWFAGWPAAYWNPGDVPGLRVVIRLYDQVTRGEYVRASELRLAMDTYGITPKGQQDRRWSPPKAEPVEPNWEPLCPDPLRSGQETLRFAVRSAADCSAAGRMTMEGSPNPSAASGADAAGRSSSPGKSRPQAAATGRLPRVRLAAPVRRVASGNR